MIKENDAKNILVEFRNVSKAYGNLWANENVNLKIKRGHIHGLLGENGAGKSTAMKLLYGMEKTTNGHILIKNQVIENHSPQKAKSLGVGMVHQHFMLATHLTGIDNILLTQSGQWWQALSRTKAKERITELMHANGLQVKLDQTVENMSVGEQQRLEILKALYHQAEILILDEPTAVLSPPEVKEFLNNLLRLREMGLTIIIITHKLAEILSITDEVSVFRKGKVVYSGLTKENSLESLVSHMIGTSSLKISAPVSVSSDNSFSSTPVLEIQDLHAIGIKGLNISIHAGEILGIAGVEGNGQDILMDILACTYEGKIKANKFSMLGIDVTTNSVSLNLPNYLNGKMRKLGLCIFPEDRLKKGVLSNFSAKQNLMLGKQSLFEKNKTKNIDFQLQNQIAEKLFDQFSIQPSKPDQLLKDFSGGNQQKIVVARELLGETKLLLAAHPTRGVDIGSSKLIQDHILQAAKKSCAVLLVSTDLDEILSLSNRIVVMYKGEITAEFKQSNFVKEKIGEAMMGKH